MKAIPYASIEGFEAHRNRCFRRPETAYTEILVGDNHALYFSRLSDIRERIKKTLENAKVNKSEYQSGHLFKFLSIIGNIKNPVESVQILIDMIHLVKSEQFKNHFLQHGFPGADQPSLNGSSTGVFFIPKPGKSVEQRANTSGVVYAADVMLGGKMSEETSRDKPFSSVVQLNQSVNQFLGNLEHCKDWNKVNEFLAQISRLCVQAKVKDQNVRFTQQIITLMTLSIQHFNRPEIAETVDMNDVAPQFQEALRVAKEEGMLERLEAFISA